jgi:hypothetical protein
MLGIAFAAISRAVMVSIRVTNAVTKLSPSWEAGGTAYMCALPVGEFQAELQQKKL